MRRIRRIPLYILSACVVAQAAQATEEKRVHIVEAQDGALAAVLIAAYGDREPVLLFDPQDADAVRETAALLPYPRNCVIRADRSSTTAALLLGEIAGQPCKAIESPGDLARSLWQDPRIVIAFGIDDSQGRVRAEGFAAATGAALLPVEAAAELTLESLAPWTPETVYVASAVVADGDDASQRSLVTPREILAAFVAIEKRNPPTLILTNPADLDGMFSPSRLSTVSGMLAAIHRSPVFSVPSADPEEIERFANDLMQSEKFVPEQILLVGDELALRSHRIPDPVLAAGGPEARGGGTIVRVEIFSGIEREQPQEFPVGRIVAENAVFASLSLARRLHVESKLRGKPVIFLANADEIFKLGETISRTTVNELRNVGVSVRTYYRGEVTPEVSQQALGQTDILVWEGHPRDLTLEEGGGIAIESAPGLVVLQGCYTLDRNDPLILIEKGTQAIVATSAAIYSAPGSGFARALFDAIVHDDADLGTAVRDARNYLLALAQLKRERGHRGWHKTYRAALAFALWGDPTYRVHLVKGRPDVRPIVWKLDDEGIDLTIPRRRLREVVVDGFRASPVPRSMLGGVVDVIGDSRQAKEMFGTSLKVTTAETHVCAPSEGWTVVSLYAPATQMLTLLAMPDWEMLGIASESGEFRFALAADAAACQGTEPDVGTGSADATSPAPTAAAPR